MQYLELGVLRLMDHGDSLARSSRRLIERKLGNLKTAIPISHNVVEEDIDEHRELNMRHEYGLFAEDIEKITSLTVVPFGQILTYKQRHELPNGRVVIPGFKTSRFGILVLPNTFTSRGKDYRRYIETLLGRLANTDTSEGLRRSHLRGTLSEDAWIRISQEFVAGMTDFLETTKKKKLSR